MFGGYLFIEIATKKRRKIWQQKKATYTSDANKIRENLFSSAISDNTSIHGNPTLVICH